MGIVWKFLCYFIVLSISTQQSLACLPPAENEDKNLFKFSFDFIDEGLVLKKTVNGQQARELLDDTGFLGIKVGLASVLDGKERTIRHARYNQQIRFIKDRIDTYLSVIRPITTPDQNQMAEKEKVIRNLNRIKELLSSDPPSNEILELWRQTESANTKFVTITAKSRANSDATWSEEQRFSSYTLPNPKPFDASKPATRCISLPYVDLAMDTFNPPRRPSNGGGTSPGSAVGTD